jgi:hypothetical protein
LRYAIENNITSIDGVRSEMEYKERQAILAKHKYSIYQSKDERWNTYLPENANKNRLSRINFGGDGRKNLTAEAVDSLAEDLPTICFANRVRSHMGIEQE